MLVWLDAQLPPVLAPWLNRTGEAEAVAICDLGLHGAEDAAIFAAVWLTCGNTSSAYLRELLARAWPIAARLLAAGEGLIEIGEAGG